MQLMLRMCVCMGRIFRCLCLFFSQGSTCCIDREWGDRPGSEASSIKAGSDPGEQRPCGAHAHPGQVQGSAAVLREPVEIQDAVTLDSGGLWGPHSLALSFHVYLTPLCPFGQQLTAVDD